MQTTGHKLARNRSGRWEVRFSECQPDGTWRSRTVSTGTRDRGEALEFQKKLTGSLGVLLMEARARGASGAPTVGSVVEAYVKARPAQRYNLAAVMRDEGGLLGLEVRLLDREDLERYRVARVRARISGGTIRRELGALEAALRWASRDRGSGVRREDIPYIEKPPVSQPRDLFLREVEEQEFYAAAMGLSIGRARLAPLTVFVALALDTGARAEAIMELTWDRVDLAAGTIDYRVPGRVVTRKRRTVVKVSRRLAPVLERAWRERRSPGAIGASGASVSGGGPVVDWGCAGAKGALRRAWSRAFGGGSTGVPAGEWGWCWDWVTPHVLRHTWATLAARAGASLWEIGAVLGDDPVTVARNYAHHCSGFGGGTVDRRWGMVESVEGR